MPREYVACAGILLEFFKVQVLFTYLFRLGINSSINVCGDTITEIKADSVVDLRIQSRISPSVHFVRIIDRSVWLLRLGIFLVRTSINLVADDFMQSPLRDL